MKNKNRKYLLLVLLVALIAAAALYIYSNYSAEKPKTAVSSEQQASTISKNISQDLGSVNSALDDIQKKLG
ncbi:MAG: hypothetical protein WA139_01025 [Candidatus Aenigmatarchaeota archaeon]